MMSWYRRVELIEEPHYHYYPSLLFKETSFVAPKALALPSFIEEDLDVGFALNLLKPCSVSSSLEVFGSVTDLIRIDHYTPSFYAQKRIQRLEELRNEFYLKSLSDRVSELESRFDRVFSPRIKGREPERKYEWTAEIKSPEKNGFDRKYKLAAEIKEAKEKNEVKKGGVEKNYKWTAESKGKGDNDAILRTYTFKASSGGAVDSSGSDKKEKEKEKEKEKKKKIKKDKSETRLAEIEEPNAHGTVVLRQAFAKRFGAIQNGKGKKKELSPQDAALIIQMTFRAYLIRRSQALRALRELAVAKSKLKEIRSLFNNFAYRSRMARDAVERQKFSEKIIVLLLTVDAIEGADPIVRAAKRSMIDELEALLDVVDPQPPRKSLSMRRRTFDMPDGLIRKEIAEGVTQVVQLLNDEENNSSTFEAC